MPANPKPPKPIRDAAYRKSAQYRWCLACDPDRLGDDKCYQVPMDVVLAHIRIAGNCGMGLKPPDDESLFLCYRHHTEFDGSPDRNDWLVRNILIPQRRAAYRKWRAER